MIKPLFEQLLIRVEKVEDVTTASGIILPMEKGKKMERAKVLAKGKETKNPLIKVGDTILFKSYSYDTIELDGKEVSFLKEGDVLGKL